MVDRRRGRDSFEESLERSLDKAFRFQPRIGSWRWRLGMGGPPGHRREHAPAASRAYDRSLTHSPPRDRHV